jgi:hypothetical protein
MELSVLWYTPLCDWCLLCWKAVLMVEALFERQFWWLKLYSKGKEIVSEFVSPTYDVNFLSNVAKFLHSTIQMHCLLQKLQEELDDKIWVRLFKPLPGSSGGEVVVYPGLVRKVVIPPLDQAKVRVWFNCWLQVPYPAKRCPVNQEEYNNAAGTCWWHTCMACCF